METNLKAIELKDLRRRHNVAGRMASGLPSHVEEADLISYEGSIINELRSLDWVPRSVRTQAREIEKANAKLEHQLHRAPTDQEMADALDITVEELRDSLVRISVVALDELWTVSDAPGDQVSLLDTIQDTSAVDPAPSTSPISRRVRFSW